MPRILASLESLIAAALCLAAAGFVVTTSGCAPVVDLETARNEAQYMPVEVAATLALSVGRAQDYGAHSAAVHTSYSNGAPITQDGCIGVELLDDLAIDGEGEVRYDFSGCDAQDGTVNVHQTVTYELPDGQSADDLTDENDNGIPDELENGGTDGSGAPADVSASTDFQVSYDGYREGLLEMSGEMTLGDGVLATEETPGSGPLAAAMTVGALDYQATIAVDGDWTTRPGDHDSRLLSFAGSFTSATGLTWDVVADNIDLAPGCNDARGGQLTARYTNESGTVEVVAIFDEVCDGCAQLIVDGVDRGRTCFPESPLFQTNASDEEGV